MVTTGHSCAFAFYHDRKAAWPSEFPYLPIGLKQGYYHLVVIVCRLGTLHGMRRALVQHVGKLKVSYLSILIFRSREPCHLANLARAFTIVIVHLLSRNGQLLYNIHI